MIAESAVDATAPHEPESRKGEAEQRDRARLGN